MPYATNEPTVTVNSCPRATVIGSTTSSPSGSAGGGSPGASMKLEPHPEERDELEVAIDR